MAEEKKPDLASVLSSASRKYGLHIGSLSSVADDVQAVSTGNLAIDHIIGVGGLPLGRSVELFGPPSSGKTTTGLQAAGELLKLIHAGGDRIRGIKPDDVVAIFDYEHALDPAYAKALGLDLDDPAVLFAQPDSLEQGANVARQLIETGRVRMSLWDSVAAMTPQIKLEAETGKSLPAVQAKLMSEFLVTLNPLLHAQNSVAVFLNHIMELMDMGGARRPGMPARTSTPGGRALKFYASVRVEYQQVQNHKGKVHDELSNDEIEQVLATDVRVRVIKNKVAAPFKTAKVRVRYGRGFDNFWSALQILVAHKKIVYSSGYHYFERSPELVHHAMPRQASGNKRPYIKGEAEVYAFADGHPEWRALMIEVAREVLKSDVGFGDSTESPAEDPQQEVSPLIQSDEDLLAEMEPVMAGSPRVVDPLA